MSPAHSNAAPAPFCSVSTLFSAHLCSFFCSSLLSFCSSLLLFCSSMLCFCSFLLLSALSLLLSALPLLLPAPSRLVCGQHTRTRAPFVEFCHGCWVSSVSWLGTGSTIGSIFYRLLVDLGQFVDRFLTDFWSIFD